MTAEQKKVAKAKAQKKWKQNEDSEAARNAMKRDKAIASAAFKAEPGKRAKALKEQLGAAHAEIRELRAQLKMKEINRSPQNRETQEKARLFKEMVEWIRVEKREVERF